MFPGRCLAAKSASSGNRRRSRSAEARDGTSWSQPGLRGCFRRSRVCASSRHDPIGGPCGSPKPSLACGCFWPDHGTRHMWASAGRLARSNDRPRRRNQHRKGRRSTRSRSPNSRVRRLKSCRWVNAGMQPRTRDAGYVNAAAARRAFVSHSDSLASGSVGLLAARCFGAIRTLALRPRRGGADG